ncbi:MAG: flagellar basal-body rod protein FlgF [Bdellovibrionaceae bacterium]|nr:flagellar basal-body rod protein FlgF [Pseudobdellovibrionaceae bacterium]
MAVKGVYTALSGAIAQTQNLDTIANNIANVNTPAFKRDQQVFQEYLTANERPPALMNVPKVPASIESFYDMQGGDKSFVDAKGTFTDFSQGSLKRTGNTFDLAIDGPGFFEVATPQGVRLTRAGNFTLDGNGRLVTKNGHYVLRAGPPGEAPESRAIQVSAASNVTIAENGDVIDGDTVVARISVVNVADLDSLQKVGNSMYGFKPNANAEVVNLEFPSLKQGFLELSNVNIVQEMTEMIAATRVFDSAQRAIQAYDGMADKLINIVGKTAP